MEQLEKIVSAMESGEVGIEESVARYEEAMKLARYCREILDRAEQRIRAIRTGADGKAELADFEPPPPSESPSSADDETRA